MIRRQKIHQARIGIENTVVEFVNAAIKNQKSQNDIILILLSGQYDRELAEQSDAHMPGYTIGHQFEQFSSQSDQKFMKWYFEESGYVTDGELPVVNVSEGLDHHVAIKLESMIYLSFWESDITLMILYQLTRLAKGENYDWFWREELAKSVSRNEFFRKKIKNQIKENFPALYIFLDLNVISQVRNAIAHSQLAPLNNNIKLLNYSKDPKKFSETILLDYEEWERLICSTLAFRGSLVSILNDMGKQAKATFPSSQFNVEIDEGNGPVKVAFSI